MKANELMIGDWVLCDENAQGEYEFDNVNYQPYQIKNGEDIDYAIERNLTGDADVYQPIPLTAEILEKNGWEYSEYTGDEMFTWPLDDDIEMPFRLVVDYNGNKYWITVGVGNYLTPINYVHELQHALRLCGIEKDITL